MTPTVIGPGTMQRLQSQPSSVGVALKTGILDAIDELVPPGVAVNPNINSYGTTDPSPAARRR